MINRNNVARVAKFASALALLLFMFDGTSPSVDAAHINCGDVLTGGAFVLDSNLACPNNPVLTLDSATLNMNGHTIACTSVGPGRVGIRIQGLAAKLRNGVVSRCDDGVAILDLPAQGPIGHHVIQQVTSTNNTFIGFDIGAHDNIVIASNAVGNAGIGFVIRNENNLLSSNHAMNNGNVGGFFIEGNSNALIGNISQDNSLDGMFIQAAENRVTNNTIMGNGRSGIRIINPAAQNNEIRNNLVNANFEGIRVVLGSTFNGVRSNTAQFNNTTDLIDDNPNCGANTWKNNTFLTDEVSGVPDGGPVVGCIQ